MLTLIYTSLTILFENYFAVLFFSIFVAFLISYPSLYIKTLSMIFLIIIPDLIQFFDFLSNIGADSLYEVTSFTTNEMYFYLRTIFSAFKPASIKFHVLYFFTVGIVAYLIYFCNRVIFSSNIVITSLLVGIIFIGLYKTYSSIANEVLRTDSLFSNFSHSYQLKPLQITSPTNIDVVVYIGESTNKQHMSLYGYFRNTTPNLDDLSQKGRLIKYSDVLSNHSHTSPSLLEALSIPKDNFESEIPATIFEKQRISLVDLLNSFGVESHLYSNQSKSGSWNYASTVVFKNADTRIFNKELTTFGNVSGASSLTMYDSLFIDEILPTIMSEKGVSFFHSYAGHGDYCKNIPVESRHPVDSLLSDIDSKEVYGRLRGPTKNQIDCYDSAIKYIDKNLMKIISAIENSDSPKALVYFSDHGESVYTGRGHDSSRFQLEMASVPLFIFLNKSASMVLESNNTKFEDKNSLLTLDYVPYLISKIIGIDIGAYNKSKYILVRDTFNGMEYINLTSSSTKSWLYNQYLNSINPLSKLSCSHQTNNLGKLNQALLSFDCFEFDAVVNDDGVVYVGHDYPSDSKLKMDIMIKAARGNKKSVWIDAKNINIPKNCLILADHDYEGLGEVLVEFPSSSVENLEGLEECLNRLNESVDYVSYYVPTAELLKCQNVSQVLESPCKDLMLKLRKVRNSGHFNSLSFDFNGVDFMTSIKDEFMDMNYHSWGITDFEDSKLNSLIMTIVNSDEMLNQN